MNSQAADSQKKTILIVDDEFDVTSTFALLFQLRGFGTLTANNGQHALAVIEEYKPDLVLSDCMMPIMDGIQLTRAIRNNPMTATIPIILMSAAPQQHKLDEAKFSIFLQKPVQFKDLIEAAQQLLQSAENKSAPS